MTIHRRGSMVSSFMVFIGVLIAVGLLIVYIMHNVG